jgi:hypothetical protein
MIAKKSLQKTYTDMTIHWKALEEYRVFSDLMIFGGNAFSECFSTNLSP